MIIKSDKEPYRSPQAKLLIIGPAFGVTNVKNNPKIKHDRKVATINKKLW